MRGILAHLFFALLLSGFASANDDLVVASIRQYQLVGPSNIHLYLYGLDGTLKKQLTNTVGCNDVDPKFSSDGHQVYFHRTSTLPQTSQQAGLYVVDLETGKVTRSESDESWVSVPTVNCCYLEWWDAHLKMTKLTPPLSVFYTAAIFHMTNETLTVGESPFR